MGLFSCSLSHYIILLTISHMYGYCTRMKYTHTYVNAHMERMRADNPHWQPSEAFQIQKHRYKQ